VEVKYKVIHQMALGKEARVLRLPSYKKLAELGYVIDCRSLPNPYLRGRADEFLRGLARKMIGYGFLLEKAEKMLDTTHTVIVGCQFGRHRSVAMTEDLTNLFVQKGFRVKVFWEDGRVTEHPAIS
jgi:RNase adaptor protein for sRNA GlmZ degradation